MADDQPPFYAPNRPLIPPRQPKPGEQVWRLRHADRVQSCELRNDTRAGAGWDVMVLEDGEPLLSRRCVDERGARYVAESFKQDLLRTGWTEAAANRQQQLIRQPTVVFDNA